jgi:hypothetical protein
MASELLKVQPGVPIPPVDRTKQRRRKYPLETMKVGDMIFEPGRSSRSLGSYISSESRRLNARFTVRRLWMYQNETGAWTECPGPAGPPCVEGTGVWRIE